MKTGRTEKAENNIKYNAKDDWKPNCSMNTDISRQFINERRNGGDLTSEPSSDTYKGKITYYKANKLTSITADHWYCIS
jgi:hypothetical protein